MVSQMLIEFDPDIKRECSFLSVNIINFVAAQLLTLAKIEVVYDMNGRFVKDRNSLIRPGFSRTYGLFNDMDTDSPAVEIVGVMNDDSISENDFWAVRTHVLPDGRIGEQLGMTTGYDDEIIWSETANNGFPEYIFSINGLQFISKYYVFRDLQHHQN